MTDRHRRQRERLGSGAGTRRCAFEGKQVASWPTIAPSWRLLQRDVLLDRCAPDWTSIAVPSERVTTPSEGRRWFFVIEHEPFILLGNSLRESPCGAFGSPMVRQRPHIDFQRHRRDDATKHAC